MENKGIINLKLNLSAPLEVLNNCMKDQKPMYVHPKLVTSVVSFNILLIFKVSIHLF